MFRYNITPRIIGPAIARIIYQLPTLSSKQALVTDSLTYVGFHRWGYPKIDGL